VRSRISSAASTSDFSTQSRLGAQSGASVVARGLGKSYGAKVVRRDFDLHVPAGQFVAVIGRSGCGKSTLLRLIAGLEVPDCGRVIIGNLSERPRDIVRLMFQEPRLLPWASVLKNVAVGRGAVPNSYEGLQQDIEALTRVGLVERAAEWPSVLSGGQKQRVALARALVSRPGLLALDEPLAALDALTRIEMQGFLENLWLREGFTAILVTHDVAEAIALADRILLIEHGAVALDVTVNLPRLRRRGSVESTRLEQSILTRLLGDKHGISPLSCSQWELCSRFSLVSCGF
jgi:sulfonate transport system ATP-binding protein